MRNSKRNTVRLSEEEKKELIRLAHSSRLKEDMRMVKNHTLLENRVNNEGDADKYINFLALSNAFVNHKRKPFRRIIDKINKM